MGPSENNGLNLEYRSEQSHAQNTLTVASLEFDESIVSPETLEDFRALAKRLNEHSKTHSGNVSFELSEQEKRSLQNAARVAEIHFYISRGMVNLLKAQYGVTNEAVLEMAENSTSVLMQQMKIAIDVGASALRLSGMLDLYAEPDQLVSDQD